MAQLLLLFAALSVFSKNALENLQKRPEGTATTHKKGEPSKALLNQQKKRIGFVNETLADHESTIEDLRQELVDADTSTVSRIEKDAGKLLKTYRDFGDIRDFDFDNKKEIIKQLDSAIDETEELLKDIKAPKKTAATEAPPTGSYPPPPPPPPPGAITPPPPLPGTSGGLKSIISPTKTASEAFKKEQALAQKKEPAKPAGIDITAIKEAKLKSKTEAAPQEKESLDYFRNQFNALNLYPGKKLTIVQKTNGRALLENLKANIEKTMSLNKVEKQQLYNAMEPVFR